ncbi:glycoside hydrolase family 16 protein NDAI_0C03030 [Naumovozyma dairenensis CBS 421]|uniref:Crh-like protein n=1 Tax=Naumovozyma dairenensis (strain ATCC 10597 / BCRC 20456 / CBS 421 / NBRC 0211 / NRRL Y-12639) TaxID=1071378 RepID=G0W852_NAUDC|nr:hypothetical protein NDAI_0C03030 [Naumovozyma dairenensis CBS 421]CCD23963.1 hypothetical protein NDAI_0C03030 [Naumovozyma dairenensis CBS 421]
MVRLQYSTKHLLIPLILSSNLHTVLADSSTVSCNPLSATNCASNPALATSFAEDFSSEPDRFIDQKHAGTITYGGDGMNMTLAKRFDNPSLKSDFYIMYGKVEVILKAGSGTGIISSFYLQSDDLDEIDIEWVGGDGTQFQSNYFSKGSVVTYDRGEFHTVSSPQTEYHNYTLDWAMDKTTWYLDGTPVRVLPNTTSEGYPQTPMYIMMGIWAGGDPSNEPGTIEWAGGLTDYSQAPFTMGIKRVIVTDYSTGKTYSYDDQSGSWESIRAEDGTVNGRYEQAQEDFALLAQDQSISGATSSSTSSSKVSSSTVSSSTSSSSISSSSVLTSAVIFSSPSSSASSIPSSSSASSSSSSSSVETTTRSLTSKNSTSSSNIYVSSSPTTSSSSSMSSARTVLSSSSTRITSSSSSSSSSVSISGSPTSTSTSSSHSGSSTSHSVETSSAAATAVVFFNRGITFLLVFICSLI